MSHSSERVRRGPVRKARSARARQIQGAIRRVLLTSWNPIGFQVPDDEYDACIGPLYRALVSGEKWGQIAERLRRLEEGILGECHTPENERLALAARLSQIDLSL